MRRPIARFEAPHVGRRQQCVGEVRQVVHAARSAARARAAAGAALKNQRMTPRPGQRAEQLRDDEHRHIAGRDAREAVGQRARDRDGRIGERRGRREPIGRCDVEPDGDRNRLALEARHGQNGEDKAESRDKFREPLRRAGARLDGEFKQRQLEHCVRDEGADAAADNLRRSIGEEFPPRMFLAQSHHQRHRRIEMRTRDRPEREDQRDQNRARSAGCCRAARARRFRPRAFHP